ncbi:acyl carrier protein [Dactylosporangium sp. NBC_01737]|uniref:acyl carrier protein n=1 Tax=Dactylosporangium sp. NBC_01737 TaxID=2975959 RepID=UPI002E0DA832|nr:acyl carrier protein [Dactylosporangium sp. NBC_01737]
MNAPAGTLTGDLLHLIISKYSAPADTTAETSFEELGFDSLVLVEVAVALSGRFNIMLTDEDLAEAGSVAGTVALIEAKGVQV